MAEKLVNSYADEFAVADFAFALRGTIAGIAAFGEDFIVLRRAGRLSHWLPEIGHSCFESDLLCGLEPDLQVQQDHSAAEALTLPEMRVTFGIMPEKVTITIRWNEAARVYVVLTTLDQMARPIDEWMERRSREQRILEEQIAEANREIAIRELRYQDVVENNDDLICRYRPDHTLSFVNPALVGFAGSSAEAMLEQSLAQVFPVHQGIPFWLDPPEHAGSRLIGLTQMRNSTGELRWVMWAARPLAGGEGRHEFQAVGRDVTVLKELEATISTQRDALEQANRELNLSNTQLKQFSSVAAHDLQAPLRQAAAFARLLAARPGVRADLEASDFVETLIASLGRSQKMVASLLHYARLSAQAYQFEGVDLQSTIAAAHDNLRVVISETDAEIEIGALPQIWGDGILLVQLWQNLLGNSLQYRGKKSPKIAIFGQIRGNFAQISVTDNGLGIKSGQEQMIFEMFRRASSSDGIEGSGIGLSLCKRIVEIHGGTLWLDKGYHDGCRFCFTLPIKAS